MISDPPRANYESLTWGSPLFFFLSSFSLFLFFPFSYTNCRAIYTRATGEKREIYIMIKLRE